MADEEQGKTRYQETVQALEDIEAGRVVDGKKVLDWIAGWGIDSEADQSDSPIYVAETLRLHRRSLDVT